MFNSDWSDKEWGCFMDSIKTGCTAFEKAHGMPVSDWLEENLYAAEVFNEANAVKAANSNRKIVDVYDFSEINTLTDVILSRSNCWRLCSNLLFSAWNPSKKWIHLSYLPGTGLRSENSGF